jgi:hypothetical protein
MAWCLIKYGDNFTFTVNKILTLLSNFVVFTGSFFFSNKISGEEAKV